MLQNTNTYRKNFDAKSRRSESDNLGFNTMDPSVLKSFIFFQVEISINSSY
jgi:hypothetical protein